LHDSRPLTTYLNNDRIELPTAIPRFIFNQELNYYRITSAEEFITVEGSVTTTMKSFAKAKKEYARAKREREMCLLALECYNQFYQSCNALGDSCSVQIPQLHKLFNNQKSPDSEEKKLLGKYLKGHGLMVVQSKNNHDQLNRGSFLVCIMKRE
jgi:hypothetical protein